MSNKETGILHIALNPVTGPWSVMRDLALAQAKSDRYRAVGLGVIHSAKWPSVYRSELEELGLPFFVAPGLDAFGTAQFVWQRIQKPPIGAWVSEFAETNGCENIVVHFHNAWMSGVFVPLDLPIDYPFRCVATFHGVNAELDGRPIRRWLHRWMAARLPRHKVRMTSVDKSNLERASSILGLAPESFTTVPNGVAAASGVSCCPWNGGREFTVGHLGSITERKGWRIAAEAVLLLRAEGLNIRLVIAGRGSEENEARVFAAASKGGVEFLGFVGFPRMNLLPTLDAMSVMSRHEGLPMTVIEAMAAGVPIVATPVGGIPEAVMDGRSGFLVPRSVDDLAVALRHLYESPELWQRFSSEAKRLFEEKYEIDHVVSQYDSVYRGMFVS